MILLDKFFANKGNIRSRLISLVLVAILPVFLFSAALSAFLAYQQIERVETGLKTTTKALTAAVDRQIISVISALEIIIMTEDFDYDRDILRSLHRRLRRAVETQQDWASISYVDVNGNQYLNTSRPFGSKLPSFKDEDFFQEVLRTKKRAISGYRLGLITGNDLVTIAIPVVVGDKIGHIITASIRTQVISRILRSQKLPGNWTAAVLDSKKTIIGRSNNIKKYLGHPATPALAALVDTESESTFEDVNQEGKVSYGSFNRSELTDWTVVLGMPYNDLMNPLWETIWILTLGTLVFSGLGIAFAILFSRKISTPLLELSNHARLLGEGREFPELRSDLTEVGEVSEALVKAAIERNQAVELRDTFLSVASHELKTPVTALQLNLQIIERNLSKLEQDPAISFTRCLTQIRRLTHLIDELLDVSRIASGKMEFKKEAVDLSEVLKDVLAQFHEQKISIDFEKNIHGEWDRGRLEQVFTNIVSNALKYGDERPVAVEVKTKGTFVHISVTDQGAGIAKVDQARIFERFERATNRSISGLGLGLWISRQIARGLNGDILVQSEVGKGSTFTVVLPLS